MEQLPEIIYVDGVLHSLYTAPLLPWLHDQEESPVFDRRTDNCERGYIGSWSIHEQQLWLTGIYAWRDGIYIGLGDLFDNRDPVAADWFSGPLVIEPAASEILAGALPKVRTLLIEQGRLTAITDGSKS